MTEKFSSTHIRTDESLFDYYKTLVGIKPKDPKWKNFSPCVVFEHLLGDIERIKVTKMHEDDVILCGFPRSGTSMMQEMIWLIMNDFNFDKAKTIARGVRMPIIETYDFYQSMRNEGSYTKFDDLPRSRTFKTHLQVQLLPDEIWTKKPKIIYISRNPKDVAVSFYHFCKDMYNYQCSLDEFLEYFLNDAVEWSPYHEHVLNFENIPNYENILYLKYESVVKNKEDHIRKVAKFLGKEVSEENMLKMLEHLSFDKMKVNTACNNESFLEKMRAINGTVHKFEGHVRFGKSDGHKSEMSQEWVEKFNKWMMLERKSGFEKN